MNMTGRCGNCANYRRMANHEDICRKTGKVVPWMALRECFEEKNQIITEEKTMTMEQSNNVTNEVTNNVTPTTKVCKDCGRELPIDSFGKSFRSSDGYSHICRECKGKRIKAGAKDTEEELLKKIFGAAAGKEEEPAKLAEAIKSESKVSDFVMDAAERGRQTISGALDQELVDELRSRGWEVSCKRTMVVEL